MKDLKHLKVWYHDMTEKVIEFNTLSDLTEWAKSHNQVSFDGINIEFDDGVSIERIDCLEGCVYSNGSLTNGEFFTAKTISEWVGSLGSIPYHFVNI